MATELALTELLLSGCTTTSDHHYLYPKGLEEAVDIQVSVATQIGMRVTLTRGSMDLSQKDGGCRPIRWFKKQMRSWPTVSVS